MKLSMITNFVAVALVALIPLVSQAQTGRNISQYNLSNGPGLKGFDPVAVFPEGGGHPAPGSPQIQASYGGITYQFSTAQNRAMFLSDPAKYEPTYGGWCAYAMSYGTKVDIQPQLYTLHGNRANYFVSARAKANFDGELMSAEVRADGFWKQISGEDPRL